MGSAIGSVLGSSATEASNDFGNGSRAFFSLMMVTIFSRSSGVMCLSRPRLCVLMLLESCRLRSGLKMFRGAEVAAVSSLSNSIASSSASESTLPDRSGMSDVDRAAELLGAMEIAGVAFFASSCWQQKVSLFHNRQLRFSKRRPSSREPAHLEKTALQLAAVQQSDHTVAK